MAAAKEWSSRFPVRKTLRSDIASSDSLDAEYYTIREVGELSTNTNSPRVLLLGYNGANNTGSEARLLAIIDDMRKVFGPNVHVTIPTLNEDNLRRYIQEGKNLRIAPIPSVFLLALQRLVKESDIVVLVEGSCYMDTWTSALLWAFLWATKIAHAEGKPSIAYAVDAGHLSRMSKWLVKREASKTDLIVMRNKLSADLLKSLEVIAPIKVTADTAFNFKVDPADNDILSRLWSDPEAGVVGIAPVDFYQWPVVIRPWGKAADCYRWPYYFSRSEKRRKATETLAKGLAVEADRLVERGMHVALIGMEGLDKPICDSVLAHMAHSEDARVFSSLDYNASQMTSILRSLDLLITSRYHAAVLSMAATVPMVAVAHDLRLRHLYEESGLMDFFLEHSDPELFRELRARVDRLLVEPEPVRRIISKSHDEQQARAYTTKDLLRDVASSYGLMTAS